MTNKSKDLDPTTLPGHFARRVHQLAVALFVQEAGDLIGSSQQQAGEYGRI